MTAREMSEKVEQQAKAEQQLEKQEQQEQEQTDTGKTVFGCPLWNGAWWEKGLIVAGVGAVVGLVYWVRRR